MFMVAYCVRDIMKSITPTTSEMLTSAKIRLTSAKILPTSEFSADRRTSALQSTILGANKWHNLQPSTIDDGGIGIRRRPSQCHTYTTPQAERRSC
jgi:hypothetical protein